MKFSRFFLLFPIVVLILSLAACGASGTPGEATSAETGTDITTGEKPAGVSEVTVADLSKYALVRTDQISDEVLEAVLLLHNRIQKVAPDVQIKTDYYREGIPMFERGEYEILVGATEREESAEFLKDKRVKDYGFALIGSKIVIAGGSDESTISAINTFITRILLKKTSGDVFYSSADDYLCAGKYATDSLTVGGIEAKDFRVVYADSLGTIGKACADRIAAAVTDLCGYTVPVLSDRKAGEASEHEILVGATTRGNAGLEAADGEILLSFDGSNVRILGSSYLAVSRGVSEFVSRIEGSASSGYSLAINGTEKFEFGIGETLGAMSFNVLVSKTTPERDARVVDMVLKYMPATVGFQEANPRWMTVLKSGLSQYYGCVGEGRDGGTSGEYNPIFYNKEIFTLVDSGTRWLSDTPDKGSKYSESSLNRIYTYALLERKSDGVRIMVVNTHFDHKSATARDKQGKVLAAFLAKNMQYPMIVTGDFNTQSDSTAYSNVVASGVVNSASIAATASKGATFTNWGSSSTVIDFVFVNPVFISVDSYRVCNETINGDYPSDHHPVFIEYKTAG